MREGDFIVFIGGIALAFGVAYGLGVLQQKSIDQTPPDPKPGDAPTDQPNLVSGEAEQTFSPAAVHVPTMPGAINYDYQVLALERPIYSDSVTGVSVSP